MAAVMLPVPLRVHAGGAARVEVAARNVDGMIAELARRFPGMAPALLDADGQLQEYVNIFVGDHDIRLLEGAATPLGEADVVRLLLAVAGGQAG